ncbi:unnamed protein product, partial [marine sediment metagenome]
TFLQKLYKWGITMLAPAGRREMDLAFRYADSYQDGLLEKAEFEPRIRRARERLEKLETELKEQSEKEEQLNALQLVIGRMKEFAEKVTARLREADWTTRREIIRAMIKEIRIDEEEVKIVYKVSPDPLLNESVKGNLQHWLKRYQLFSGEEA